MSPPNVPRPSAQNAKGKYQRGSYKRNWGRGSYKNKTDRTNSSDVNQKNINTFFSTETGPYKGWKLYFPSNVFENESVTHLKIQAMEKYITRNRHLFVFELIIEKRFYQINVKSIIEDETFISDWSSFSEDLTDNPSHSLSCLGLAMHQSIHLEFYKQKVYNSDDESNKEPNSAPAEYLNTEIPMLKVHPMNYEPIVQLKYLKVNYYGKLVSIRGTVIRCGSVMLIPTWIAFQCKDCGSIQVIHQPDGTFTSPMNCKTSRCQSKKFNQLLSDPLTKTTDWQTLKLQESISNQYEGGRVPRTIEIELSGTLVESCIPGDDVTITGIVKVHSTENSNTKQMPNMFSMYIDAVSLVNNKNENTNGSNKDSYTGIEFNLKDYYAIQKIHSEPSLLRLLVQSMAPKIFGQEMIKFGLLLGLFGGGIGRIDTRNDIHVLMVGDPGLGKSQLLIACTNIAPRGVYVGGNTSSNCGLTVTLTRESGGDFVLEAGALVLADQGICCIDEFDKMPAQHQALLEAMEQQTISIAKGGVICSLRARCGILAAANPVGGHYNKAKSVSENIKLGPALLSRFDLVFILLDRPDEQLDNLLSEHVLALHSAVKNNKKGSDSICSSSTNTSFDPNDTLKKRLQVPQGEQLDIIPTLLLRKYIAYARHYVHPKLNNSATEVLQSFYIQLRKDHQAMNLPPITARQLQAMVRLTQARAKLELREEATEKDAFDVIELMHHTLIDLYSDQHGNLDFNRSQNGSGVSGRGQVKKFLNLLQHNAKLKSKPMFDLNELRNVAVQGGVPINDVNSLVSKLNIQGFLLKKLNSYELVSLDF